MRSPLLQYSITQLFIIDSELFISILFQSPSDCVVTLDVNKKSKREKYTEQTLDIKTGDQSKKALDTKEHKKEKKLTKTKEKKDPSNGKKK